MVYDLKAFGNHLKEIRKSLNLTQKDVKSYIHVNEDTLRKLESGDSFPKIETLDMLSLVYKRDLNFEFSKFKVTYDDYMEDRIKYLSPLFRKMQFKDIQKETESLKAFFKSSKLDENEFTKHKVRQFTTYLTAIGNFERASKDKSREDLVELRKVINYSDIQLKSDLSLNLDILEIRILVLTGILYRVRNEFDLAKVFLNAALRTLRDKYQDHKEFITLYLLVAYNLMTTHHRLDEHKAIKTLYKESLAVFDKKLNFNTFSSFFLRMGISKYYLEEEDYNTYVRFGLSILRDLDYEDTVKRYVKIFGEKYPFLDLSNIAD